MNFKQVEWEQRSATYFVADVAFGIQITVDESRRGFAWEMGNYSFTFKQGICKSKESAMKSAVKAFQNYVTENIAKCCD